MDEEKKETLDELEQAYKDTISSTTKTTLGMSQTSLADERAKIDSLIEGITKDLEQKKALVESKLNTLKNLKSEIEAGLEELKEIEAKKEKLQLEIDKITKVEQQEKEIESEVANMQ